MADTHAEALAALDELEKEFLPPPIRVTEPTLQEYTDLQCDDALEFLDLDTSNEIGWKWPSLTEVIGPQLQQELLIVAARPGNGKTTFAMNHMQYFVDRGQRVLYIGMEMTANLLRAQFASWAHDLTWKYVARRRWDRLPPGAKDMLREHIELQRNVMRDNLFFAPDDRLTIPRLEHHIRHLEDKHGQVDLVVVDHLHRMSFGNGAANLTGAMSEGVTALKSIGTLHNTRMMVCAQLKRHLTSDVTNDYLPASADAIKQTGSAEQEANTILTLNRGMKPGVSNAQLVAVRRGVRPVTDIAMPGVMNCRIAKCRMDGDVKDTDVKFFLHKGRMFDNETARATAILEDRYGI